MIEEQAAPTASAASNVPSSDESILATIYREKQAHNYTTDMDFLAGLELILAEEKQQVSSQPPS
ncbi:hypothetical protein [Ktedonospora formicarum]|uniref:Uncharacterized protein n=1 Tax=Ktedonospora formicarum TaxID=2778364 RepID=A0A8J3MU36_9CHLR|nr:hypothetical protein [Ktedonospora formicarum]GHO47800.1 hypothetical protein KSX_59630 [Ktedonospora formicarum]